MWRQISKTSKIRSLNLQVSSQIADGQKQGPVSSCLPLSLLVPVHVHLTTWLNVLCAVGQL